MTQKSARIRLRRINRTRLIKRTARSARRWTIGGLCTLLVVGFAMASVADYYGRTAAPSTADVTVSLLPNRPGIRFWGDEVPGNLESAVTKWIPHMPRLSMSAPKVGDRPLVTYLALSGGGSDGAFGAGLLTGWSASGQRPTFDVVTGVSAGALIAPFAFLGPDYDAALQQVWTSYGTADLAPRRWIGLLGGPSFTNTEPLKRIIAKFIDADMLKRIASEYQKGRLLLVVTTNLDAQRPMVWNLGEIATTGTKEALELTHQVLMASAAIPGLFPPVQIPVQAADGKRYDEMHVDGGVTREVFVAPAQLSFRSFDRFYPVPPKRRIFVIKNGKTDPEYLPVRANTMSIIERSLLTMIKNHQLSDIYRIYRMAMDDDVEFAIAVVPPSFNVRARETFDKSYLDQLFKLGVHQGAAGGHWQNEPPEYRPLGRNG